MPTGPRLARIQNISPTRKNHTPLASTKLRSAQRRCSAKRRRRARRRRDHCRADDHQPVQADPDPQRRAARRAPGPHHVEPAKADQQRGEHIGAAVPAMETRPAAADRGNELERPAQRDDGGEQQMHRQDEVAGQPAGNIAADQYFVPPLEIALHRGPAVEADDIDDEGELADRGDGEPEEGGALERLSAPRRDGLVGHLPPGSCQQGDNPARLAADMTAPTGKHDFARQGAPTVSAGYAGYLWRFALARGADADALARRSGSIDPAGLADPDARVPFARYCALMHTAQALCRMPGLALHLGAGNDFREFSVVGLDLLCGPNHGRGAGRAEPLWPARRRSRSGDDRPALPDRAARRRHRLTDIRADPDAFPEMTEATWARFIGETRRHFPDAPFALAVHVTHPAPAHAAEYAAVFGTPVTFASDRNAIRIDPSWLGIELHNPSRYAFECSANVPTG